MPGASPIMQRVCGTVVPSATDAKRQSQDAKRQSADAKRQGGPSSSGKPPRAKKRDGTLCWWVRGKEGCGRGLGESERVSRVVGLVWGCGGGRREWAYAMLCAVLS
eukprot:3769602-Rhodomonas_salina.3